jgi:hypothetical protein
MHYKRQENYGMNLTAIKNGQFNCDSVKPAQSVGGMS